MRFSQLVADHRQIKEIDINPLLVSPEGMMALDARVVLHDPALGEDRLPKLAIRPYPAKYVAPFRLKNGARVTIRPIRHQDEPLMAKFHQGLSERSVYLRYFQTLQLGQRVMHERLLRRCFIDYDREMALVAEVKGANKEMELLGVARLIKLHGTPDAEFAVLVSDHAQRSGLGLELMKRIIQIAGDEKIRRLCADVLRENEGMRHLLEQLHFTLKDSPDNLVSKASLQLPRAT